MLRFLFSVAAIAMMFSSVPCDGATLKENVMFEAFNNGYKIELSSNDCNTLDDLLTCALEGSRPMPAIGVSLHDDTMKATEKGIWLRFAFDGVQEVSGMTFDQLLMRIDKGMYGMNVIRGNACRYDGRCYYIDLDKSMDKVYDFLAGKAVTDQKFSACPKACEDKLDKAKVERVPSPNIRVPSMDAHIDAQSGAIENIPSKNKDNNGKGPIMDATQNYKTGSQQAAKSATQKLLESIDF